MIHEDLGVSADSGTGTRGSSEHGNAEALRAEGVEAQKAQGDEGFRLCMHQLNC